MKIAIYDPYLHILGGAEKYILTIAKCFTKTHEVTIFSDDPKLLNQANIKFGLNLPKFIIKPWITNSLERREELKQYDKFIYVTDGSIFFATAKTNILLIQSPDHIPQNNLINQIKLLSWQKIICYSAFIKQIIQKRLGKTADILFVPVETPIIADNQKENFILSVGRFFENLHSKKQLEMVKTFKKMIDQGLTNTQLILIGSIDPGGKNYFQEVVKQAKNYPIKIINNASFTELTRYYQKTKIYWHATGYGEDLEKHPQKAEHFGVTTIEAMSYGVVPIVFACGGQMEIIKTGKNGYLWKTEEELINYTNSVLDNQNLRMQLSNQAIADSQKYSVDLFCSKLKSLI